MLLHAFQAAAGASARVHVHVQVVITTHINLTRIKDAGEKQYGNPGACIVGEHFNAESKGAEESQHVVLGFSPARAGVRGRARQWHSLSATPRLRPA